MRKVITFVTALLLMLPAIAAADDIAVMSTDDLRTLRDTISLELAARAQTDGVLASWTTAGGRVDLVEVLRGTDRDGVDGFSVRFAFTNTTDEVTTFSHYVGASVYQNGYECEWAFINDSSSTTWSTKVLPGGTFNGVLYGYHPNDDSATIDVEIFDATNYAHTSYGLFTVTLPE